MRDESDQKELVLGNKQLLSIFFIVVAMLGVAFTLGYMIGRNTANVSAAGVSGAGATQATPIQSPASSPAADSPETAPQAVQAPPQKAPEPVPEPKVRGTRPAKPYDSEATHAPVAKTTESGAAPAPVASPTPAGSSYLQVAAMKRADADHMASVLQDRGFPTTVRESSKEGLFRVLVGPYKDMPSLVDAKQKLKTAGFDNPLIER
jgi:cell division protein FtsN